MYPQLLEDEKKTIIDDRPFLVEELCVRWHDCGRANIVSVGAALAAKVLANGFVTEVASTFGGDLYDYALLIGSTALGIKEK